MNSSLPHIYRIRMYVSCLRRNQRLERSALRLWQQGSIPSHSPEDILGIFAFTDLSKPLNLDPLFDQLRKRIMGISPLLSFQFLQVFGQSSIKAPDDIIEDLSEMIQEPSSTLSPTEYGRAMELIAGLKGPRWDPSHYIQSPKLKESISSASPALLIKLSELRIPCIDSLRQRAFELHTKLSPIETTKLALYLNENELIPNSISMGTIAYAIQYFSAWDVESENLSQWRTALDKYQSTISPAHAQVCLWSLLAIGQDRSDPLLQSLFRLADQGIWRSLPMKHQCFLKMNPADPISLPIRIPQLALGRKQRFIEELVKRNPGMKAHAHAGNYMYDFSVNEKFGIVNVLPTDPLFRIYSRFLPQDTIIIDSTRQPDRPLV